MDPIWAKFTIHLCDHFRLTEIFIGRENFYLFIQNIDSFKNACRAWNGCYLSGAQSTQHEPASAVVISLKEFTICRVSSNAFLSILFSWNFHTAKIFLTENLCWIMNLKCRHFIFINYFSLHCLPYIFGSPGKFSDKLKIFRQNFLK